MNTIFIKVASLCLGVSVFLISAENCSSFKIRSSAFIGQSDLFRDIYGKVGGTFELEVATQVCNHVEVWANFDWFSKHGHSIGFCDPTKVRIANFSFGLKFPYYFNNCLSVYLGAGPSFAKIWVRNDSVCGLENVCKGLAGGVIKSGLYWFIQENVFLDFFVDYINQPTHFATCANVGGVRPGIGLGITF